MFVDLVGPLVEMKKTAITMNANDGDEESIQSSTMAAQIDKVC